MDDPDRSDVRSARQNVRLRLGNAISQTDHACGRLRSRTVLPVHYEGRSHFTEGLARIRETFAASPEDVRDCLFEATHGVPMQAALSPNTESAGMIDLDVNQK